MAESGVVSGTKAGWGALKSHWIFFAVLILLLVLLAIGYDKKNGTFSAWRTKLSTFPLIGPLFASFALILGSAWIFHAARAVAALTHGAA